MLKIALLSVCIVAVAAEFTNLKHKTCEHKGTILSVKAENYEAVEDGIRTVAVFTVGQKPKIRIEFRPSADSATMKNQIKAKIGKSLVDFPQPGKNACNYGVACPVAAQSTQVFEQEIEIQENQKADTNIPVRWEISNEAGETEVCIIFLARVQ